MYRLIVSALLAVLVLALGSFPSAVNGTTRTTAGHQMYYGLNTLGADSGAVQRAKGTGFNWITAYVNWWAIQPSRELYNGNQVSMLRSDIDYALSQGFRVLVKIRQTPAWANGCCDGTLPPNSPDDLANFMGRLAGDLAGRGVAYEIFNEPNLDYEWGGLAPDPARYASLLRAAYPRIKSADPNAIVVTAGLATVGMNHWNGDHMFAMDDYNFINGMYDAGAKGYFDALGSHPYGFAYEPESSVAPLSFRRAEAHHQLMVDRGDGSTPIWATEFGWILDPSQIDPDDTGYGCTLESSRDWQKVSPATQADYLARAYDYAYQNWPWMQAMFVFNLDFNVAPWYSSCEQMRFYSIQKASQAPRPAYTALANMVKSGIIPPTLAVSSDVVGFLVEPSAGNPASRQVFVRNEGAGTLNWTASDDASWLALTPGSGTASGDTPGTLSIQVDKTGLAAGLYAGRITVSSAGTAGSPKYVDVVLSIGDVNRAYLPLVVRIR